MACLASFSLWSIPLLQRHLSRLGKTLGCKTATGLCKTSVNMNGDEFKLYSSDCLMCRVVGGIEILDASQKKQGTGSLIFNNLRGKI